MENQNISNEKYIITVEDHGTFRISAINIFKALDRLQFKLSPLNKVLSTEETNQKLLTVISVFIRKQNDRIDITSLVAN